MANLTNFLEPVKVRVAEPKKTPEYAEWQTLKEHCDYMTLHGYFGAGKGLSNPETKIAEREDEIVLKMFENYQIVPEEMTESVLGRPEYDCDRWGCRRSSNITGVIHEERPWRPLVEFSNLPRVGLPSIRNAAEKLSFAILPINYISASAIIQRYSDVDKRYGQSLSEGFGTFVSLMKGVSKYCDFDVYILCPIEFYDPWAEVKDRENRDKIFGGELAGLTMVLGLIIPSQKNLYKMSQTNAENIHAINETMEQNFATMQQTLRNVQSQISWLSGAVNSLKSQVASAQATAHAALAKAELVEYRLECLLDPLVFAVPQGTNILRDDVSATMLLCFGEDMPLDFFLARGLTEVKPEVKKLEKILRIHHPFYF